MVQVVQAKEALGGVEDGGDDGDGNRHNRHTDITSGWVHHNKLDKMAISKNNKFCSCLLAQEFSSGKSGSLF